ncbi:MAG: DUF5667 domain-containing protein [Jatrophihabitans sp.]
MGAGRFTARSGSGRARQSREAELISRLTDLPVGPVPDSRFKAELRSQLVAIAPRILAESATDAQAVPAVGPAGRSGLGRAIRRPLIAVAGSAAVLVLLLGLAVWVSNGALPGQSLYGVKRASENVQLSIAGGDTAKGKAYLQLATSRVKEAGKLVGGTDGQPATLSAHTRSLVASTLSSADSDSRNGMQSLGKASVAQMSADPIAGIANWASQQRSRLSDLQGRLPAGSTRNRVEASQALLQKIATRASQLSARIGCGCLSQTHADELGPLPCTGCGAVSPSSPAPPAHSPSGLPSLPTGLPATSDAGTSGPLPSLPGLGGGSSARPSGTTKAAGGLPALTSSPVSTGADGVAAELPGGVSLRLGPGGAVLSVAPLPLPGTLP